MCTCQNVRTAVDTALQLAVPHHLRPANVTMPPRTTGFPKITQENALGMNRIEPVRPWHLLDAIVTVVQSEYDVIYIYISYVISYMYIHL